MQFHKEAGKFKMVKKMLSMIIVAALILPCPGIAMAKSDFEFYFFGTKLESFKDSNWLKVAAGAAASVLVHELGHALYLQYSEKQWDFHASPSSGFAIQTTDNLSDTQWSNFGRAGFALQTLIGTALTTFEVTRKSDFTKGWVGINAVQVFSYKLRNHEDGDDFKMIDRGGGNGNLEFSMFSMISAYNLKKLDSHFLKFPVKNGRMPESILYNDVSERITYPNRIFGDGLGAWAKP
jgi:hypothetical protein